MAYQNFHSCLESILSLLFEDTYKIKQLIIEEKGKGEFKWGRIVPILALIFPL